MRIALFLIINSINLNVYSQKKVNFFGEAGLGIQYINPRVTGSQYLKFINSPNPKLFLGLGLIYKIKSKFSFNLSLNVNSSKIASKLKYKVEPDRINYVSNLYHKDLNYGIWFGTTIKFKKNGLYSGLGLKIQKISVQLISTDLEAYGTDTFLINEQFTSNNIEKNDNLFGWYANLGFPCGKKKKYDFIIEISGSLNKPIYGSNELYVNNLLHEKISYKKNFYFTVFKIRRLF